jgi:hypothetical protein
MYDVVDSRPTDARVAESAPWDGLDPEGAYRQALADAMAVATEAASRFGPMPAAGIRYVVARLEELG